MPKEKAPNGGAHDFQWEEILNLHMEIGKTSGKKYACSDYDKLEEKPYFFAFDSNHESQIYPLKCKEVKNKNDMLYLDENA